MFGVRRAFLEPDRRLIKDKIINGITNKHIFTKKLFQVVKAIAEEYHIPFLPLQEKLNHCAERFSAQKTLGDGVHPAMLGAITIADAWIHVFDKIEIPIC